MPISWSEPSSSEDEAIENMAWAYADGNYGIPQRCFCGLAVKLESVRGGPNCGRRFYRCPEWINEGSFQHIFKWWDEAVEEQFEILGQTVERLNGEVKEEVRLLREELNEEIQELNGVLTLEICMIHDELERLKQGDSYLCLILLCVFAAIAYVFK
ncbi:uncharacterized protein At1g43920, Chloroplastic-like [Eutrema salsugineum]|uniref:uncharacterized protein At1g43920, Chloroplastic-like n=1 Tax=Eutrema salsugineum TaxID=72664 RepID=UPI000CED67B1|nr:uncharacterized protein At1g43920, Chloroplastic-like [Eutrema salsugineum]